MKSIRADEQKSRPPDWRISMERLRGSTLACGGVCFAILLVTMQDASLRESGELSLGFCVVGMPLAVWTSFLSEVLIDSKRLRRFPDDAGTVGFFWAFSMLCTGVATVMAVTLFIGIYYKALAMIFGLTISIGGIVAFGVAASHDRQRDRSKE
jgi:hypothetical protein